MGEEKTNAEVRRAKLNAASNLLIMLGIFSEETRAILKFNLPFITQEGALVINMALTSSDSRAKQPRGGERALVPTLP